MSKELDKYYDPLNSRYDFRSVFAPMKKYFDKSQYVFANLETPLSKSADNLTNKQYEFCTNIEFARALYESGVDCVAAANNHCMDRDYKGILSTIDCLNDIGFKFSGIHDVSKTLDPLVLNIEGLRVGFLSYTYGTNAFSNNRYLHFNTRRAVDLLQEQEENKLLFRFLYRYIRRNPEKIISKTYK